MPSSLAGLGRGGGGDGARRFQGPPHIPANPEEGGAPTWTCGISPADVR
jgi:hypothetical protein